MTERVYLTLCDRWDGYAPEIGLYILAYLDIRLNVNPQCKYHKINGRTVFYLIFRNEAEALNAYNLLTPNSSGGVFSEIRLRTGYHTSGRTVEKTNGAIWHDRTYRLILSSLRYALDHDIKGTFGRCYELSRAIEPIGYGKG